MQEIAKQTFLGNGAGAVVIQLMLVATVGFLASHVARASGKGQAASMIDAATTFTCVVLVGKSVYAAITAVNNIIGK